MVDDWLMPVILMLSRVKCKGFEGNTQNEHNRRGLWYRGMRGYCCRQLFASDFEVAALRLRFEPSRVVRELCRLRHGSCGDCSVGGMVVLRMVSAGRSGIS